VATLGIYEAREGCDRVIRPVGEVDIASAPELDELIERALRAASVGKVIIDLDLLEFIDSAGLGVLLRAAAAARCNGGRLRVRRPRPAVARLFEITGARALLPLE
jgi:anti-sigma B factor antagonist